MELQMPWAALSLDNRMQMNHVFISVARCTKQHCKTIFPESLNLVTAAIKFQLPVANNTI